MPNGYSGVCFERRLLIARAVTCLFLEFNLGEGWMFLMLELLVGCVQRAVESQCCLFVLRFVLSCLPGGGKIFFSRRICSIVIKGS